MNLHQRGQALLNRTNGSTTAGGVAVLYTRGGATEAVVGAVSSPVGPGGVDRSTTVGVPTPGTRVTIRERDYLFAIADLTAAGFGEPAEGDTVTEVLNGEPVKFTVTRQGSEPAWRWADRERTRVRVHTRKQ